MDGEAKTDRQPARSRASLKPRRLRALPELQMPDPRLEAVEMGRAKNARAVRISSALFPRVAFLFPLHLQFTLCRAPRELRAEAQSRSPDDKSLRAAIFGPGCRSGWRGGARGSACKCWLPGAAAASPAKERREGEPGGGLEARPHVSDVLRTSERCLPLPPAGLSRS